MKDPRARFDGLAEFYARHRPSYPSDCLDWICDRAAIVSGTTVADVGSGTGILARRLAERGAVVYAVEPNEDMREVALRSGGGVTSVAGTAEASTLAPSSVDVVTAAQSFHWFDTHERHGAVAFEYAAVAYVGRLR